jgi:hypothetical protein
VDFVVSMTHRGDELEQLMEMWYSSGDPRDPFTQTIFTPLFASRGTLPFMEKFFKHRSGVIFDSGGYYVQQGVISYEDLYQKLLTYYGENNWASWYVLPDYVPTSLMSLSEVEECVNATVTVGKLFFAEMPTELRPHALPVVQGYTLEQVRYCVENYVDMGVDRIGFGSFGTSGNNNSINTITRQSIEMIEFLKQYASRHGLKLHLFGIGTPGVLPLFHSLGVDSFDSSCWSRTVGYGNVYLPFRGRRNISQGMVREVGGEAYRPADFAALKSLTGHTCPYCTDIGALKQSRVRQMLHNLYVILETVEGLEQGQLLYPELVGLQASKYLSMRPERVYRPLSLE